MPDDRWLLIELGVAVERLIDTKPVQRMILDAENERAGLVEDILKLDVDDERERTLFRNKRARIAVLDTWQQFFARYIDAGRAAAESLQMEDSPPGADEPQPPEGE